MDFRVKTIYNFSSDPLSVFLHNSGFEIEKIPFIFTSKNSCFLDDVVGTLRDPLTFGGCIETPLKTLIMNELDYLSPDSEIIGSVDTITKDVFGDLHGHNTDWIVLKNLIKIYFGQDLPKEVLVICSEKYYPCVCYALKNLSIQILLWHENTPQNELAENFQFEIVQNISSLKLITNSSSLIISDHQNINFLTKFSQIVQKTILIDFLDSADFEIDEKPNPTIFSYLEFYFQKLIIQHELFLRSSNINCDIPKKEMALLFTQKQSKSFPTIKSLTKNIKFS